MDVLVIYRRYISSTLVPLICSHYLRRPDGRARPEQDLLEHLHVFEGVFERNGDLEVFLNRPGEGIPLQGVLVANRELFHLAVDRDAARTVGGSVERNLD